jgi:hypothetical protein
MLNGGKLLRHELSPVTKQTTNLREAIGFALVHLLQHAIEGSVIGSKRSDD